MDSMGVVRGAGTEAVEMATAWRLMKDACAVHAFSAAALDRRRGWLPMSLSEELWLVLPLLLDRASAPLTRGTLRFSAGGGLPCALRITLAFSSRKMRDSSSR